MCEAAGCQKRTPGGGLCQQCQTERKWESSRNTIAEDDRDVSCFNCGDSIQNKKYHPDRAGVVLCEQCWMDANREQDLIADGGVLEDSPSSDYSPNVLGEYHAEYAKQKQRALSHQYEREAVVLLFLAGWSIDELSMTMQVSERGVRDVLYQETDTEDLDSLREQGRAGVNQ